MIKENDFILNMVDLRAWGFRSFRLLFFFFLDDGNESVKI